MQTKYLIMLVVTALLLLYPLTRNIIMVILPLGFAPDDFVFCAAVGLLLAVWLGVFPRIPQLFRQLFNKE